MISNTHRRLRDATQAHHERLERRIDIFAQISHPDGRQQANDRVPELAVPGNGQEIRPDDAYTVTHSRFEAKLPRV